jgi:outer membrane usher protein
MVLPRHRPFISLLSRLLLLSIILPEYANAIQTMPVDTSENKPTKNHALWHKFNRPVDTRPASQEVIVPIYINGQLLGEIHAIIADNPTHSTINLETLNKFLTPFMTARLSRQIKTRSMHSKTINFKELSDIGLQLTFDAENIILRVSLDPIIRKPQRYNLHTHQQQQESTNTTPNAKVSGALDYFISGGWINDKKQPVKVEFDGHINIKSWVLQNRHSYLTDQRNHWQRRQTLLTHDWPDKLTRLSVGDLNPPRVGFMGSRQVSGLSYGTLFELQPQLVNYPISEEDFYLEQDARVEVFIDNQLISRRNLTAGRHNIYDLPLIDGVNQVELKITDALGRQQTLRFFETQDQRLLLPGLSKYSISFGVPRSTGNQGIEYNNDNPMLSAFYRYGWYEDITVGSWLELSKDILGLGITGISNQVYGALTGEFALSNSNGLVGQAIRLGYRYRTRQWTFDTEWSWQDADFATLGQTPEAKNPHNNVRFGITLPKIGQWSSNISISHSRQWQGNNKSSKRLTFSRTFAKDWRLSVNISHFNALSEQESFMGLQFYWNPMGSRHQANGSYSSNKKGSSADYSYRREGELGMDFRAGLQDNISENQQRADINYVSPKVTSRVSFNHERSSTAISKNTQRFTLGSAVAFADGHWATSRPLRGQPFAIFSGKSNLLNTKIGITRGGGITPTAFLNGAENTSIMPGLSAYYANQLNLDLQDVPMEMQIRQEQFNVKPAYRSAVVLEVGAEGGVYVTTTLLGPLGQPIIHKVVNILPMSGVSPILSFTDEAGLTLIEGLAAGNYDILVPGTIDLTATFSIPEGIQGRLSLSPITLTER